MIKGLKNTIIDFIESEEDLEISVPRLAIEEYELIFAELGYELNNDDDDTSTNGWQVDFWYSLINGNKEITLSGSLWHGDDYSLSKDEDE